MSYKKIKNKSSKLYKSKERAFLRKQKMEFTDFVWYLIMQKGHATRMELDEYLKNKNDTYEISISKHFLNKEKHRKCR